MAYASVTATRTFRIALVAFAIVAVVLFAAPGFMPRSIIQDLILIFVMCTIAQCWNLLAGYAGLISVGQQAFVGLGGYGLFALVALWGIDPLLSLPLAAIIATLIAVPGCVRARRRP